MKMENFEKTTYMIGKLRKKYVGNAYQTIFLSTFQSHTHELEIARFEARAPRAGTVDVKRLRYGNPVLHFICVNYVDANVPYTFEDALNSTDCKNWQKVMSKEIECIDKNKLGSQLIK